MAEWSWFAGEPKGNCPVCHEPLRQGDMLVAWREHVYCVGCLIDMLTTLAPKPMPIYPWMAS